MKYLIVGLGNIGPEYELTRHNIGFLTIDRLADQYDAKWESGRLAFKSEFKHKGRTIHLIKPTTYMNLSGKAVNYWMKELSIPKENILVLVDEVAIPFGKLRMRAKGSAAGHNGLKGRQADYVLGKFKQEEFDQLPEIMDKAIDMVLGFCTIGIAQTMTQYND